MSISCRHGQLARSCERCDDAEEIAELRAALKMIYQRVIETSPTHWGTCIDEVERIARLAIDGNLHVASPKTQEGEQAVAAERERCASLCDGVADVCADTSTGSRKAASISAAQSCARLIRGNATGGQR